MTDDIIDKMTEALTPSQDRIQLKSIQNLEYALVYEGQSEARLKSGEPLVVLVPGVPGTERDFRYLSPLISRWAPVVRVVFPGFGELHHVEDAPSTIEERGQYLRAIADRESWGEVMVLGHSMGGVASLQWALIDPRVRQLSLLCSVGVERHRGMIFGHRVARLLLNALRWPFFGRPLLAMFRRQYRLMGFRGHPLHLRQQSLILRHVRDLDFVYVRGLIEALSTRSHLQVGLAWAMDDLVVDQSASLALERAFRSALSPERLATLCLQDGGHNPQRSRTKEIDRWLHSLYSHSIINT